MLKLVPSVVLVVPSAFLPHFRAQSNISSCSEDDIAYCDGCYCVPEAGEACPTDQMPKICHNPAVTTNLRIVQQEGNPLQLPCNPYRDNGCDTVPPLEQGEACVVEFIHTPDDDTSACPIETSYRLATVPSLEDAQEQGQLITHTGACGVCSTLQDLAAYMEFPDLTTIGTVCGGFGFVNLSLAVQCFEVVAGFTTECAKIWAYNTQKTSEECGLVCTRHTIQGLPNNMDPPQCLLADCIQCDEDKAGPIFQQFAGRTRRRTGLLSGIVRNCSSLATDVTYLGDPCDSSSPSPTPSSSAGAEIFATTIVGLSLSAIVELMVCAY